MRRSGTVSNDLQLCLAAGAKGRRVCCRRIVQFTRLICRCRRLIVVSGQTSRYPSVVWNPEEARGRILSSLPIEAGEAS